MTRQIKYGTGKSASAKYYHILTYRFDDLHNEDVWVDCWKVERIPLDRPPRDKLPCPKCC